jgi:pyruvate kinase
MILAFTPSLETLRQLRYLRGVEPYQMAFSADPDLTIEGAVQQLKRLGRVAAGAKLIVVTDILSQDRLVDSIQLRTVR